MINGAVEGIKGHFHVEAGTTGLVVSSTLIGSIGMTVSLGTAAWAFSFAAKAGGTDVRIPRVEGVVALVAAHTFAALSIVFVVRYVHETKGKKLEEMG